MALTTMLFFGERPQNLGHMEDAHGTPCGVYIVVLWNGAGWVLREEQTVAHMNHMTHEHHATFASESGPGAVAL